MAEDEKPAQPQKPYFDFTDPNINTVYAVDTAAIVGDSEINIYLSDGGYTPDGGQKKVHTRVIIPHAMFIRMMDFWASRYGFIQTMYGGNPTSLEDFRAADPDKYNKAYDEYLTGGKTQEKPKDE